MDLGDKAKVPVISFSATSPSLRPRSPYFIQTGLSDDAQAGAIAAIVESFKCAPNSTFSIPLRIVSRLLQQEISCVQGLHLWRNSSSQINDELYKGYRKGNSEKKINEITAGLFGRNYLHVSLQ
nr:ABC transporter A family member 7-like [Ipomoea batatas]